jgi:flagellar basal-body rod protein FlgB
VEEKNFINGSLMGKTVALLSHALDYRSARQNVISGNLANVDTPGYRPKELNFDQALRKAVEKDGISLNKTDRKHFPNPGDPTTGKGSHTIESLEGEVSESNQLNIDKEMAKMVQNNLLYEASAKLLARKFDSLRMAIEGNRR